LLWNDLPQWIDGNGDPYAGAQLFFYAAGSSTKQTVYQDSGSSTAHSNPIELDANGRVPSAVWATEGSSYKIVLAPSDDTDPPVSPIFSVDGLTGINDASVSLEQWAESGFTPTYISTTQFSVAGDQTSTLHVGRRVKVVDGGGTKYGYISVSAYTTLTTVTVVLDSGNLETPTSTLYIGVQTTDNPSEPLLMDSYPIRSGSADKTKKVRIEADTNVPTGTTVVLTAPSADITIGKADDGTGAVPLPRSYLAGGTLSNNGSDATNDIDVAAGTARDSTNAKNISWSALTKQLDAAWAAGTNAGMLDTGAIADTTYHVYAIRKDSDGTGDILASASASSPTMPSGYTYFRRIGSIIRESAAILAFTQMGDEFLWKTPEADISANNPGTSAVSATLTTPAGVKNVAIVTAGVVSSDVTASAPYLYVSSLDQTDVAASANAFVARVTSVDGQAGTDTADTSVCRVRTNTGSQVRYRVDASSASVTVSLVTHGWVDRRGRDD
jgi:hypothetical protein